MRACYSTPLVWMHAVGAGVAGKEARLLEKEFCDQLRVVHSYGLYSYGLCENNYSVNNQDHP